MPRKTDTSTRPLVIKKRLRLLTKAMSLSKSTKKNLCVKEPSSASKKWTSAAESKHQPQKLFWGCFTYIGPAILIPILGMSNSETCINYNAALFQLCRRTFQTVTEFFSMTLLLAEHQEEGRMQLKNRK